MSEAFDMGHAIAVRRDGGRHSGAELQGLALAAARGEAPDYQLAAWLMAAYLNPLMTRMKTAALTPRDGGERDALGLDRPAEALGGQAQHRRSR